MSFLANRLYLREAELVVGTKSASASANVVPADARVIKTRIKFSVEKTSETSANKATISVYNINQETRNFLEKTDNIVILRAGYKNAISTIYYGDAAKGLHERSGADVITKLECGDGEFALQQAKVTIGLGPGATNQQVINQAITAITSLSISRGFIESIPLVKYNNAFTFSGMARDLLREQLRAVGMEFHIQDGELNVMFPTKTDEQIAVEITQDTGLIGFPTKTKDGVDFKCLMNPFIRPGRAVKVQSKQFQGEFGTQSGVAALSLVDSGATVRCRRVVHEGDTQEGSWESKVECTTVGGSSG